MTRLLVLTAILSLAVALGLPAQSVAGRPEGLATAVCSSPLTSAAALDRAGFQVTELAPGATPRTDFTCPEPTGCGGVNVVCQAINCATSDTGQPSCTMGNRVLHCMGGKTIHVTTCGCQELFEARCCSTPPQCLCAGCNSGSTSVSCQ
jgi:hypothetical protein